MCSIGGNVATNAGGLCCVKYGVTADYVGGVEGVLPGGAAQAGVPLPAGVPVLALCPTEAGGRLRLRDTALTARTGTLHAPGWRIRPVDLRGSAAGTPAEGEMSFPIAPFGIYSFILEAL